MSSCFPLALSVSLCRGGGDGRERNFLSLECGNPRREEEEEEEVEMENWRWSNGEEMVLCAAF